MMALACIISSVGVGILMCGSEKIRAKRGTTNSSSTRMDAMPTQLSRIG